MFGALAVAVGLALFALSVDVAPDGPDDQASGDVATDAPVGDGGSDATGKGAKAASKKKPGPSPPVVVGFGALRGELRFYKGRAPAPGVELTLRAEGGATD